MSFRIEISKNVDNRFYASTLEYENNEFQIAQAVFNVLASRKDNEDVKLFAVGKDAGVGKFVLLADKADIQSAINQLRINQARQSGII